MSDTPTRVSFNPTEDERLTYIKSRTDELIAYVKDAAIHANTEDGHRRAALAATNYEQAAMWAVKSLFS